MLLFILYASVAIDKLQPRHKARKCIRTEVSEYETYWRTESEQGNMDQKKKSNLYSGFTYNPKHAAWECVAINVRSWGRKKELWLIIKNKEAVNSHPFN